MSWISFLWTGIPAGGRVRVLLWLPAALAAWEAGHRLGPRVNTARTEFCPVVSPDGRGLYFTSDRSFADRPLEAALSTREWNERLDGPGATGREPMSPVFEALGGTPR